MSKRARNLGFKRVVRLSEEEAFAEYVAIRFEANGGEPQCTWCGAQNPYFIPSRRKWKCRAKDCQRQFSATSGTPFASRKLSYSDILIAIAMFAVEPKGLSAIRLTQKLEVWYKTAFVLLHKIREQLGIEQHKHWLRGTVEVDGGYNGGYVRPANENSERIDRRATRYSAKRKCVVVMRERRGRTRTFICSEAEAAKLIPSVVEEGSTIVTDYAKVYARVRGKYRHIRVDHDKRFALGEASTNWAESYFSRLDRSEKGIHHNLSGPYFDAYADEMAWREDARGMTDKDKFGAMTHLMTRGGVSRKWKGYWQRRKEDA